MISKQDEAVLAVAIANERIASEINTRLIESSASPAEAQALLDVISDSKKERKEIKEYLIVAMASRKHGSEIAEQLELVVKCLEFQAADDVANNAALNEAQAKIKSLSKGAKEYLTVACANKKMSERLASAIEASGQVAAGIADAVI